MRKLVGAAVAIVALAGTAAAQMPAAIVEDIKGKVDGVEVMDYVAPGKVIQLAPKAAIVLGYMKSCWRETIVGGTVVVGAEQSMVHLGDVQRVRVDCDARAAELSEPEGRQSAATTFRTLAPGQRPASAVTLYGLSPVVELPGPGTLVIERVDVPGERHALLVTKRALLHGRFYDLAKARTSLVAGGTYTARLGNRATTFTIAPVAAAGATPVIGRLLHL